MYFPILNIFLSWRAKRTIYIDAKQIDLLFLTNQIRTTFNQSKVKDIVTFIRLTRNNTNKVISIGISCHGPKKGRFGVDTTDLSTGGTVAILQAGQ